jgi:hypothetical protein
MSIPPNLSSTLTRLSQATERVAKVLEEAKHPDGSPIYATVISEFVPNPRSSLDGISFPCAIVSPQRMYVDGVIVRSLVPWDKIWGVESQLMGIRYTLYMLHDMRGSFHYHQRGNDIYREYFVYLPIERAESL